MKKYIIAIACSAFLLISCTEDESRCGNSDSEIKDANGNVIGCIDIPETPNF